MITPNHNKAGIMILKGKHHRVVGVKTILHADQRTALKRTEEDGPKDFLSLLKWDSKAAVV